MASSDAQPLSPVSSAHHRNGSFSSSTSDGSSAPGHSLDNSSSSLSEARSSSTPSTADPPVGHFRARLGTRRSLSAFRSSNSPEKRQSLVQAQLERSSFGDKLKFALDLSFAGGDPRKQLRSYQEPVVVRSAKARAIEISRSSSRPGTAISVTSNTTQPSYSNKPFALRRNPAPECTPEPEFTVPELDSIALPPPPAVPQQTYVEEQPIPPRRSSAWRLANLNTRLEQQLELPPVVEDEEEDQLDEMGFVRNLASRLQRIHTPPNNAPAKPRPVISLPIGLVSASNNIIYEAPDLTEPQHERQVSSSTQNSSGDEAETSMFSDPGLTDSSSISSDSSPNRSSSEGSPTSADFDAPHTSYYNPVQSPLIHPIPVSPMKADLNGPITVIDSGETTMPPAIPQRAMSHSKREHVRLARARSMRSRSTSRAPSDIPISHRPSLIDLAETPESVSPMAEESEHPFETELAQLDQMAQELARAAAAEHTRRSMIEDRAAMANSRLEHYSARDYQFDLDSLISELTMPEENPWDRAPPRPLAV